MYDVQFQYQYEVHGQRFRGTRLRYNNAPNSARNAEWARAVMTAYPVGLQTQVFYNPKDREDALLSPGLNGQDIVLVLLLMPFNCVMLALWLFSADWLRRSLLNAIAGGVPVRSNGRHVRVRLPRFSPAAIALTVLGLLAFIAAFVLGTHPTLQAALPVFCFVIAAAGGVYLALWRSIRSGDRDLVIDGAARTLSLPKTFGRKETVMIAFSEIGGVDTKAVESWTFETGLAASYAPTIHLRDRGSQGLKVARWYDRQKAEAFVKWLRSQLQS